jgi:hypothetical protein
MIGLPLALCRIFQTQFFCPKVLQHLDGSIPRNDELAAAAFVESRPALHDIGLEASTSPVEISAAV